ncbi:MAG: hypothetical protein GF411_05570 [Candidatus Lokiarchaeota archaeon]|nr:hypothetical protein [Candidatus Lokiarchaeota archaeon]
MFEGTCRSIRNQPVRCPDCSGQIVSSHGHKVCSECGLVMSRDYVDPTFQMGEKVKEGDPTASVYGSLGKRLHIVDGLGSYIDFHKTRYFRDAQGRILRSRRQKQFKRLKTVYSTRIRIGQDEAKYRALRTLNHVSKLLMIHEQVRDRTAYIYQKILDDAKDKISNNILLIAVCLLMAVREFKDSAPITLEEIAEVFERCGHRVSVRSIVREALRLRTITGYSPEIRKPEDYVPRVISMLVNNSQVIKKIESRGWQIIQYENVLRNKMNEIIEMVPASKRGGRNPFIFAVSSAYAGDRIISEEYGKRSVLTQKLTAKATEVAEYSIRDHYGMMKKIIEPLMKATQ